MSKQENSGRHNKPSDEQGDSRIRKHRKVKSVLELGRYNVGDTAWWVTVRYINEPAIEFEDVPEDMQWMLECHPKEMYTRGPFKKHWNKNKKLPKLHHADFLGIVPLITSDLMVEQFKITDIIRSNLTGEYYYGNEDDEWMPQSNLFDTKAAAYKERNRIINMLRRWVEEVGS
jgi:hypothetical protein